MIVHASALSRFKMAAFLSLITSLPLAANSEAADVTKWPTKAIHIIVPYAAGGSTDMVARLIASTIRESVGYPVIVENKAGATGTVGTAAFLRSAPNDHSFELLTNVQPTMNEFLYKLSYDPAKDFNYVGIIADSPDIIAVSVASSIRSFDELINTAKASPGKLNYASSGIGGSGHLLTEQLNMEAGIKTTQIPYPGNAPATMALIGNQVDYQVDSIPPLSEQIRAGKIRVLATTSPKRLPELPEVPTIAELGYPNGTYATWYGVIAQTSTPSYVVKLMNAELKKALAKPEVVEKLKSMGFDSMPSSPEEMRDISATERARWKKVISAIGLKQN